MLLVKTRLKHAMQVVGSNDKKRFVIDDSSAPPRIRAAQGHRWAKGRSIGRPCGYFKVLVQGLVKILSFEMTWVH